VLAGEYGMDPSFLDLDPGFYDIEIILGCVGVTTRGSAKAPKIAVSYEDVNGDNYLDLVAFFRVQDLVDAGALTELTTELELTCQLLDATPIQRTDAVRIVQP
jgi:hypothetical protein